MNTVMTLPQDDSVLVLESLKGRHEAFGLLVQRYQSLICALIYG